MSHVTQSILFAFLVAIVYALPVVFAWGWVRWVRRPQPRTLPALLSLVGFLLATTSGLLAISMLSYAHVIGGFPYYDPTLLRIYRWGTLLSLSGVLSGLIGLWQPGPLRWHAPACAVGTLLFWIAAASTE